MVTAKEKELKQYFTPYYLAKWMCERFVTTEDKDILEPSCGSGVFFDCLPTWANIVGVEIDIGQKQNIIKRLSAPFQGNAPIQEESTLVVKPRWTSEIVVNFSDFLTTDFLTGRKFDLIIGNPPYGRVTKRSPSFEMQFIRDCSGYLNYGGRIVFLLQTKTLNGVENYTELWKEKLRIKTIIPIVQRPSFSGDNETSERDYCIFELVKQDHLITSTTLEFLDISELRKGKSNGSD